MSSPNWKPSSAYRKSKKVQSIINESILNQTQSMIDLNNSYKAATMLPNYNIIAELNGKAIVEQDKDIEIERLKTTCFDLNNKATVVDDLRKDNDVLTRRLNESESERKR